MTKLQQLYDMLDSLDWKDLRNNHTELLHSISKLIDEIGVDGILLKQQFIGHYLADRLPREARRQFKPPRPGDV